MVEVLRSHGVVTVSAASCCSLTEEVSVCVCSGAPGTCHGLLGFFPASSVFIPAGPQVLRESPAGARQPGVTVGQHHRLPSGLPLPPGLQPPAGVGGGANAWKVLECCAP